MKPAFHRLKVLALLVLFWNHPLFAQNAVTLTNSSGDESTGSFEAGVTYLNANGGGNLVTQLSNSNPITLSNPLPVVSQNVTLLGAAGFSLPAVNIIAQTGNPVSLVFQNNFSLGANTGLLLHGAGSDLDAAVSAGSFNMSSGSGIGFFGGGGNSITIAGGSSQTGGTGGDGLMTVANLINMDSAGGQLFGGAGGSMSSGGGGVNDTGGLGGNALAQSSTWTLSDSNYSILGGNGGSADGTSNILGGQGGGVNVSVNNWAVTNSSGFTMSGGNGGAAVTGTFGGTALTGGAGGGATVAAGALTVSTSQWFLNGGNGGMGTDTGGLGGAVSVHWNSLNETQGADVNVVAGNGGDGSQLGGQGGGAAVAGVSIVESGSSSNLNVSGGTGGGLSSLGGGANTAGNGGSAGMTMAFIQLTAGTGMDFFGGSGGNGFSLSQGTGGNGGNASVSIGAIDIESQSALNLSGGAGGNGGTSGNGGTALVLANSVTLDTGGNLTLEGGNAGASSVSVGAAGGVGVGFQTAFIGTNASLNLLSGTTGSVVASIDDLTGAGSIEETGSNSVLELGTGSFSGTISGTGSLIQNGASGALTLSGNNGYTGGTVVEGTLVVDTGGSLGSGGVSVENSKTLEYVHSASAGNASVTSSGTVDFENTSTAGAATFTLVPGGYANFSNAAQGGTASFNLAGGSAFDVSTSTAGVVTVGSIASSGGSVSLGGAAGTGLAVGINDLSTTISGVISDVGLGGALIKQGTGILALNQLNTYQGGTLLQQGRLEVADATSLGSGSVSVMGGTLSSMGSAVSLNVGGNYVQGPGGTIQLGLYGTNATGVDWLNVNGSAKLGGTLDLAAGSGFTPMSIGNAVVLIDTDNGLTGNFQTIEESFPGMRLLPIYQPGLFEVESIDLSFAAAGQTLNEKAIGADLDVVYLSPGVQNLMVALGTQSDAVLKNAYDQLSPEGYSVLYQSAFEGVQLQASEVDDRLAELRDASQTPALPTPRRRGASSGGETALFAGNLSVADEMAMLVRPQSDGPSSWGGFFSGNGGVFTVGDTSNAEGFKDTSYGLSAAGADYRISNQLALGVLAGYAESDVSLNGGGSVTETGGQLGVYGTWYPNQFYFNALLEGGINHYSSQRQSYQGDAGGKTQGFLFSSRLGVGYDWKGSGWVVGPLAAIQWTQLSIDGFTEQGPLASLAIASQTQSSWMSQMGAHAQWCLNLGGIQIQPGAKISWEHEFTYQGGIVQAGFGQGDSFTVEGPAVGQDGFLARGSLDTSFSKQLTVSLGYQGELGRANLTSAQFDAGMRFGF